MRANTKRIPLVTSMLLACFVMASAHTFAEVRTFLELPEDVRKEILVGIPRSSKEIPDSPFGTHTTVIGEGGGGGAERMVQLLSEAGYKWLVDYLFAGDVENQTPQEIEAYWSNNTERFIPYARLLGEAGINLLIRLDPLPWGVPMSGPNDPTPERLAKYEAFVRQIVRQLGPHTKHWQIWNEPNLGNETPVATPEAYVRLVAHLAKVIREEQPDAVIYGPATAMLQCMDEWPYPWIPRALDAGLLEHIDVFAYHPYRQPYQKANIPEHASEFYPWDRWGTYENQIADLRQRLREHNGGLDVPMATTEDGSPNVINVDGEQEITWVIGAKYELRKCLLDFYLGVYPRTHFCFYRPLPSPFYDHEASFDMLTRDYEKKPIYYAAQNLHAVLDSTYKPDASVPVKIILETPEEVAGKGLCVQTYTKRHEAFDELLIFFWAAEEADDLHARHPARLEIVEKGWEAPLLINLMAMPGHRAKNEVMELVNPEYVNRLAPVALKAVEWRGDDGSGRPVETPNGVAVEKIEVRDYPMLIKWVRLR